MLKGYREYKKTDYDWLPSIPNNWVSSKIGELFEERRIKVSDKEYAPLTVGKMGVVPQLSTVAKSNDGDNRKLVKSGDFVINSRSDRKGSSGLSSYDGSVSLINIVLTPRKGNSRYYHYLLKSHYWVEEYYRNGRGIVADLWTTRFSEMKSIVLPIPPRSEQDQIVRYLDWKVSMINKYINAKKKQIELLKECFSKKVTDLLVNKTNSYMKMKHLTEYKLQYGANASGVNYTDKYPRYIRITDINNDGSLKNDNVLSLDISNYNDYLLKDGDILFARSGATVGKSFIYKNDYGKCCFAGYLIRIIPDKKIIIPEYLYYFTLSSKYLEWLKQVFIQTTIPNINAEKYKELNIPYTPLKEQAELLSKIQSELRSNETMIKNIECKIKLLQEYRTRLISDVVTGRVDVQGEKVVEFENVKYQDIPDTNEEAE